MLLARVPLVLMPLLSPRQPCMLDDFGCDDGCSMPEEHTTPPLDLPAFTPEGLSVLSLPGAPDPSLSHTDVVETICRGLQFPNMPAPNSGAMRLHEFATFECKASLTGRRGDSDGPEAFAREASLWALPGNDFFALGEGSFIPATQTRGAMATVMVEVVEEKGFRFRSGFQRTPTPAKPEALAGAAAEEETEEIAVLPPPPKGFAWAETPSKRAPALAMSAAPDAADAPAEPQRSIERYQFTLIQERRPPLTGCWMVKGILPVTQHALFGADVD